MKRINSIDIVRGIVMIIMALDHTRDLLHITSITQQPTDLATTTPMLFFTRWITHLCAPTFVLLSGASAYISLKNINNVTESRNHLLTRGIWLIILDLTLINFGVWFDIHFNVLLFDVISAIGFGFIILSLLLKCSAKTIGIIGLLIIFLHNLSPNLPLAETSLFKRLLMPFFAPNAFPLGRGITFVVGYPPIPWLGIILAGFWVGSIFNKTVESRKKLFLIIGFSSLLLFVLLRFINIYGDSFQWTTQKNYLFTFMSFINVTKYPPSLLFCLLTLGIMFLILSFVEGMKSKFTDSATVYGKVPLFYFVIHWFIIHPIMFAIVFLQGFKSSDLLFGFNFGRPKETSGVELWAIYLIWLAVLIILLPLCKRYGQYKEDHKDKRWLRYV
ncbi:MAG: heparan-alpha-glucosaminide N-acetyltransferase domain-containing protein [bacterium]|nr:heparan-alpha-glucosaminide N-acetyltransferase domain-containing protein [bacterium]